MYSISIFKRRLFFQLMALRDIFDTYIAPGYAPVQTKLGFKLAGGHSQHHKAMQEENFEPVEIQWLLTQFGEIDVFVDVGANIGYFSCLARHMGKQVIAIEPMRSNLRHLLKNIDINAGLMPEVYPIALAESPNVLKLYGASSTGASLVNDWAGASSILTRLVPVNTLDNLIAGRFNEKKLLIKMDVEGAEFNALKGSIKTIQRMVKPAWLIEITLNEYMPGGVNQNFLETFDLFWDASYESYVLTHKGLVPVSRADIIRFVQQGHTDYLEINYVFLAA